MKPLSLVSLIFLIITGIFIFYTSSLTFEAGPPSGFSIAPILYHVFIFFLFFFFLFLAINKKSFFTVFIIFLASLAYAGLDELHQYFVPGRSCSFQDFSIDVAGILVSLIFLFLLKKVFKRNN